MIDLSIIIVNYKGWTRLRQCLDSLSLIKQPPFTWEVIIVDNKSNDDLLTKFKAEFPQFLFIENTGNNGFASGCNYGAKHAQGKFLFFLNPDTIISENAISSLLKAAYDNPEIGAFSCLQYDENKAETKPYGYFPRLKTLTGVLRFINSLVSKFKTQTINGSVRVFFPDWISGSAVIIDKETLKLIGGWNEDYWMYYEDTDLCKKLNMANKKVAIITGIILEHNHGGSSRLNYTIQSITKSEAIISKHVYLNHYLNGLEKWIVNLWMVLENIILLIIFSALNVVTLLSIPKLRVYIKVYWKITLYYLQVLKQGHWLSLRSMNNKR